MSRPALLALALLAACGGSKPSGNGPKVPPVDSQAFDMRVQVPTGWRIDTVESTDSRFLMRLEKDDWILWVGARTTDAVVDPMLALRDRGGTKSTLKTSWMGLDAAMAEAEASFSDAVKRVEQRLLAGSGMCLYELTMSAPQTAAAQVRPLLLELRTAVEGLSGATPRAPACAAADAPPADADADAGAGAAP